MARSNRDIPHYYLQTRIDMTRALRWLEAENAKRSIKDRLLPAVLTLKAVALALKEVPELNGFWINDQHQPSDAIHVGFAISLRKGGLVTPAIHETDRKTLDELMAAMRDVIDRARSGHLRASEMSDPTITVTNLGDLVSRVSSESSTRRKSRSSVSAGLPSSRGRRQRHARRAPRANRFARGRPPRHGRAPWRTVPRRAQPPPPIAGEAMTDAEIKAAILEGLAQIAPESDPTEISPNENIRRALDIDSFDFLNFLIGLHEKLGVDIPEADYGKLNTLGEIVAYLAARTK